uniref:Glycoprotein n=1 Tax=Guadeloupe mosquito quaranja-like virus 1 TaxID=2607737 RepID=A0A894KQH0_9ORTO|nr:MAG: hypothetical protein 2 [Guadeloupe mosquito quaranja-like virus 1]
MLETMKQQGVWLLITLHHAMLSCASSHHIGCLKGRGDCVMDIEGLQFFTPHKVLNITTSNETALCEHLIREKVDPTAILCRKKGVFVDCAHCFKHDFLIHTHNIHNALTVQDQESERARTATLHSLCTRRTEYVTLFAQTVGALTAVCLFCLWKSGFTINQGFVFSIYLTLSVMGLILNVLNCAGIS